MDGSQGIARANATVSRLKAPDEADPRDLTGEVYWNRKTYPGGTYEGQYKSGKRSGTGKYSWDDGRSYEGSFMDGLAEGEGVEIFPDGSRYEGSYVGNCKEGHGKYTYLDGDCYEGNFEQDRCNGVGTYTCSSFIYHGQWNNGSMHGKVPST